ncbi:multimeric flavodoxin WrbA [Methanolinea mesophila]|uniref:flavodoxin family protein n=1 Tax=Methanolinea mesophila TaxID=547055 RepID=UPI001AE31ACA|nr:flavodoxin family protein [Methanolinea mesophila]MBP1927779.1 multimeric flavodoxin WrbA [Methanolinea mesophila]
MTKVIAINGSPRREGNTALLIRHVLEELGNEGVDTEEVNLGGNVARGCTACMQCMENLDGHCVFDDDIVNACIDKMGEADGIILGSPVYFLDVTAEMKGLIDRAGFVSMVNRDLFRRKVGVPVTVMRRAGAISTLNTMMNFMAYSGMIVAGKPVTGVGHEVGSVQKDEEGIRRAHDTGKNMAWLLNALGNRS